MNHVLKMSLRSVLSRCFSFMKKNALFLLLLFCGTLTALTIIPKILTYPFGYQSESAQFILEFIIHLFATAQITILIISRTFDQLDDEVKLSLGETKQRTKSKAAMILPMIAVWGGQSIAFFLGFMFFIIPGFIALSSLICSPAALAIEKFTVTDAYERSMQLTKGYRLKILAIVFITSFLLVCSTILLLFVGNFWLIVLEEFGIVFSGMELLAERAFSIMALFIFSITSSYIYLALRSVKSGEEKEILATV